MNDKKEIWLPTSETRVTVADGEVQVWDTMVMTLTAIKAAPPGFTEKQPKK